MRSKLLRHLQSKWRKEQNYVNSKTADRPPPPRISLAKFILTTALILTLTLAFASCGESGGSGDEKGSIKIGSNPSEPVIIPESSELTAGLYTGNTLNSGTRIASVDANNVTAAVNYVNANTGAYTLLLDSNVSASAQTLSGSSKTLTIIGKGSERTITLSETSNSLFTVNSGVTLTLENFISLKGYNSNNIALVWLDGGTFNMKAGSKITGNTSSSRSGGVTVINSGTFIMSGGTISGNTGVAGGGVYVPSGTFTMSGGIISGNTATSGGGGGVGVSGGTFIMTGGTISGNTSNGSGGSNGYGGGVHVGSSGTFRKTGGTIYGSNGGTDRNTASTGNTTGHAVYKVGAPANKYRDTTAGTGVNLDSNNTTNWNQ